jgi:hypothetical protein
MSETAGNLPNTEQARLRSQHRDPMTCGFYDVEQRRCGVYAVRPHICRNFGHTERLECPVAPKGFVLTISPARATLDVDLDTLDVVAISTEWRF